MGRVETKPLDRSAWKRFCELVDAGAGVSNAVEPGRAPNVSPAASRYVRGLVEHHRVNNVPFLLSAGLAGQSVLEVGAGTAGLSVAMVEAGVRSVTGVEPNALNHEAGLWRARAHRVEDRVELRRLADTTRLPFADGTFDAAVASSVLHCMPSSERAMVLAEMFRVVRPGGVTIVCASGNGLFPGGPHADRWWTNLAPERADRLGLMHGVRFDEIRRTLEPLGATLVRPSSPQHGELARWRQRLMARRPTLPQRFAYEMLFAAYRVCEATVCAWLEMPIEALVPYVPVAFRKLPGHATA